MLLAPAIVLCLAVALGVARGVFVRNMFENAGSCESCLFWQTFASDLWVVGAIGLLGALQLLVKSSLVRRVLMLLQLACLLLMAVDVMLFKVLTVRLYVADIEKFGAEFGAIATFVKLYLGSAWKLVLVAAISPVGLILWFAFRMRGSHKRAAAALCGVALCAFAGAAIGSSGQFQFVADEWVRNWFAMNFDQGVSRPFSDEFKNSMKGEIATPNVCRSGAGLKKNIVLVVVESLSAYHSALLDGRGWTPELDRIAGHSRWFTNFHANGFTTDHGLIALFTGKPPLPSVGRYGGSRAYDGYWNTSDSLPKMLEANGYDTAFLTTGDLRFLEKGAWVGSLGFAHVEGSEHPSYAGQPRLHFNAAPDEALFRRFMEWRASRISGKPYFAGLLTVSSHPPYIAPDGQRGEEAAIRYVDQELGRFYRQLGDAHFFDDGLLIIVGDHRAMTLVTAEERTRHAERALSRIPFIVASDPAGKGTRIELLEQQADLVHS
ncbi:MAG: LTA synthase family protein, partial [Betaproteobacteria bacterium]